MTTPNNTRRKLNVCLVSDFFYPRTGGVEMHQYCLAQELILRGHKVVAVTSTYDGERQGIRYMTNGLKVYYCPVQAVLGPVVLPTGFAMLPLLRTILIREQIDIIHGHQSTSVMFAEALVQGKLMGYTTIFTDHSLFPFGDFKMVLHKLLMFLLRHTNHVITVSNTCKENLVLRTRLDPERVSAIPNAVDTTKFQPDPSQAPSSSERINIIIISRLVFRKGITIAVQVIPNICTRFPKAHFIIGGDGPQLLSLKEMIEQNELQDRVELLGNLNHTQVPATLVKGHIFLNCSLTESFCIAILEAASCGLYVVTTNVGGVPEVLPPHMCTLTKAEPETMIADLSEAIQNIDAILDPLQFHQEVGAMYSWADVAERTEQVYVSALKEPQPTMFQHLQICYESGFWVGKLYLLLMAWELMALTVLRWLQPKESVEVAVEFPNPYV